MHGCEQLSRPRSTNTGQPRSRAGTRAEPDPPPPPPPPPPLTVSSLLRLSLCRSLLLRISRDQTRHHRSPALSLVRTTGLPRFDSLVSLRLSRAARSLVLVWMVAAARPRTRSVALSTYGQSKSAAGAVHPRPRPDPSRARAHRPSAHGAAACTGHEQPGRAEPLRLGPTELGPQPLHPDRRRANGSARAPWRRSSLRSRPGALAPRFRLCWHCPMLTPGHPAVTVSATLAENRGRDAPRCAQLASPCRGPHRRDASPRLLDL